MYSVAHGVREILEAMLIVADEDLMNDPYLDKEDLVTNCADKWLCGACFGKFTEQRFLLWLQRTKIGECYMCAAGPFSMINY